MFQFGKHILPLFFEFKKKGRYAEYYFAYAAHYNGDLPIHSLS